MGRNSLTPPGGILFDFGDTLCRLTRFDPAAGNARCLEGAFADTDLDPEVVQAVADRMNRSIKPRREASGLEHSVIRFQRLLYDLLGVVVPVSEEELERLFWEGASSHEPEPGVRDMLVRMKGLELPMGVVSNFSFSHRFLVAELDDAGLTDFLDPIIASSEYGIRKPVPLLFETAAVRLGVSPEAIWFVGDNLFFDVGGAQTSGMTGVWYRPGADKRRSAAEPTVADAGAASADPHGGERPIDTVRITPDVVVSGWCEFSELVEATRR